MRICIRIQTEETPREGVSFAYTAEALKNAAEERAETLVLQAPPMGGRRSETFSRMTVFERTGVEFLREHEYPRSLVWVCETEAEAALLRQVYNYWFAEEKAERLI